MIKISKVKVRGRISDDKNNFVTANIVSIVAGITIHSIVDHIKNIDVPLSTKYRLFNKGNVKRKKLIHTIDDINWLSDKKKNKTIS